MNKSLNEKLINFINNIAENVFLVQFVISTIGLVLNVPHLLILLHNSMRTSSTNSIMIGIAICDLTVLSAVVYERVQEYWFHGSQNPCMNQLNYFNECSLLIGTILQTVFEETSFWLGVFLAFTRLIIMKAAGTTLKISKPLFGYLLILVLVGLSSLHSASYYHGFSIVQFDIWKPKKRCTGYPAKYSEPTYVRYFADDEELLGSRYQLIHGVSQILVSVSYPVLAILLILEIRKSVKFATKVLSCRNLEERHRTCRMILVMTVFYVIASTPAGISEYVQLFVKLRPNSILLTLIGYGSIFISTLFCLNASSHGIINFTMSSKYRQTVRKVLRMEKQQRGSITSISVFKNSSHI